MKDILKIIRYSWSLRRYYLISAIFVIIVSLLNQVQPFAFRYIVDEVVKLTSGGAPNITFIWLLLGTVFAAGLLITILENIQGYYGDILGAKLNTLLSQRYYGHILKLPLEYYDNQVSGRITSRLERSINTISRLMNAFANNFVGFFLTSAITLVILAFYAWPVALLLSVLFPFYIWLTTLSSRSWQKRQEPINKNIDINNGRFIESVSQIRAVKSFVQEVTEWNFFAGKRRLIEKLTAAQSKEWHWYDVARRAGLNLVFLGIFAYIVFETYKGHYTPGELTFLLLLTTQAQWPLFAMSFIVDNVQQARAGSKDFFAVMELEPSIADAPGAEDLQVRDGRISFQDVRFNYNHEKKVLRGVSFDIEPDTKVALVGESGEGKTTITNLLLRFYALTGGQILIDGQDISSVTQASLRQAIGVVFQEPALFSGAVRENIAYGTPSPTEDQLRAAAKAANALEFIEKLPHGFETEIGERGVKLSGGQKQRLAIARAILKNPPILILDEATSSLDSKAEHEVQQALQELMRGRTTLIIAHRLSTIASVDKIIGLRGGLVAEQGRPSELAHAGGIYAELLELQNPTEANKAKLKKYELAR